MYLESLEESCLESFRVTSLTLLANAFSIGVCPKVSVVQRIDVIMVRECLYFIAANGTGIAVVQTSVL